MSFDLIHAVGLSRQTSSKVNVQLIEEITDVLEQRGSSLVGELKVAFSMTNDDAVIDVSAPEKQRDDTATDAWFPPDERSATAVNPAMKTMSRKRVELSELAATVSERRIDRTQGGLGLMRLTLDSTNRWQSEYKKHSDGGGSDDGGSSSAPATVVPLPPPKKPA